MCSIAGVYWFGDNKPKTEKLEQMVERALSLLDTRGPDESSISAVQNNCVLGGNRLIIRGSPGRGSMPFVSDKCISYYNGEIYNYSNWAQNAISDGEVILPLYDQYGVHSFKEFDGEFAISVWDGKHKRLMLTRDPFGTKPIYFSLNRDRILWASSASAINAMERHEFCSSIKSSVYNMTNSIQEPYTSYKGIWLIPPGHTLIIQDEQSDLFCYNMWKEVREKHDNVDKLFEVLEESLETRLDFSGVIGIPLSAGIDSGIIAFMADKLNINYHIFSIVEMFGNKTSETDYILERIGRLKNASKVTLLKCNQEEYQKAIDDIFSPNYYDSERFDSGGICTHTVFDAMRQEGIRVAIDGSGGDEIFHGYPWRENFGPVEGWPTPWKKSNYFYSLYTSLLDYTAKCDRAGAYFSIETRYPYQSLKVMRAAGSLSTCDVLKWPLRRFLLERLDYGAPLDVDINRKIGFALQNSDRDYIISDMRQAWCRKHELKALPSTPPKPFPFKIGVPFGEHISA